MKWETLEEIAYGDGYRMEVEKYVGKWHWEKRVEARAVDCGYEPTREDAEALAQQHAEEKLTWEVLRESAEVRGCTALAHLISGYWHWSLGNGEKCIAYGREKTRKKMRAKVALRLATYLKKKRKDKS